MQDDIKEVLLSEEELQLKIAELGRVISDDYKNKNPLVICVLKGAAPFMSDLIKRITIHMEMDFMAVSSYGASTTSSGEVRIIKDLDVSVEKRHILIVEDIIDSGLTLTYLHDLMHRRNAESVKIITLLDKPHRRTAKIKPDYCGFVIPDEFVVGYGLDYAEKYRNLPFIGILEPRVYTK